MVAVPPLVLVQPAAELAVVGAVVRGLCLMVVVPPPVLVQPAAGLLVVKAVGRVRREMDAATPLEAVRPEAVRRAMRTVLGVATGRRRVWPSLSSPRPARFLPEVLATR